MVCQLRMYPDDCRNAHVGANVSDSLKLNHQICVGGVGKDIALPGAHAFQMISLQQRGQLLDNLGQRLNPSGRFHVPFAEGQIGFVQDVRNRLLQYIQLRQGGGGEHGAAAIQRRRVLRDIDRVVSETFKLRSDLVVLIHDGDVILVLQMRQEAHKVFADLVREVIDFILVGQHLLVQGRIVLLQ